METKNEVKKWCKFHNYDFYKYKGNQSILKIARNLVDYKVGESIYNVAFNLINTPTSKQTKLF